MTTCTLDDLLKAIGRAIADSGAHVRQKELDNHTSLFDADDQGVMTPKTLSMLLPNRYRQGTDEEAPATETVCDIPQSTLVQNNQVALDTVSLEIDCLVEELKGGDAGEKQLVLALGGDIRHRSNTIKLSLTYRNAGIPEGIAKINDELLKLF